MSEITAAEISVAILVGGLGTRLRSVLPDLPKPMAPVGGRPFVERLVATLARAGFRNVVFCVGYRAEAVQAHFGDGRAHGVAVRYSHEQELLGTAGALRHARPEIASDPFLVMNGDSFCGVDFDRLLQRHAEHRGLATLAAAWVGDASRYGSLHLGPMDAVVGFTEKGDVQGGAWINAGVYVLSRAVLDRVAPDRPVSLEREIFPALAAQGALHAFKAAGPFIDIGVPADLARAASVLAS